MNDFSKDFELRRNVFGLAALLKCPEGAIPPLVASKVGEMLRQLTLLCQKQHTERLKVLEENRDFVRRDGKSESGDEDDEELGDDDAADDGSGEDSVEEWKKSKKLLEKYGAKLHTGQQLTAEEMKDLSLNMDDDDDDDSDYEFGGGDMGMHYDSRLDDEDELKFVRDSLSLINSQQADYYQRLMTAYTSVASD